MLSYFDRFWVYINQLNAFDRPTILFSYIYILFSSFMALVKYIISNAMCYTMLYMLEWMRKGKHKIGTSRTQELCGPALLAYIHGGIP